MALIPPYFALAFYKNAILLSIIYVVLVSVTSQSLRVSFESTYLQSKQWIKIARRKTMRSSVLGASPARGVKGGSNHSIPITYVRHVFGCVSTCDFLGAKCSINCDIRAKLFALCCKFATKHHPMRWMQTPFSKTIFVNSRRGVVLPRTPFTRVAILRTPFTRFVDIILPFRV